jgi:hypothetical protein
LDEPVKAYNVNGTENKQGIINAYVNLKFKLGDQKFNKHFYVTGLENKGSFLDSLGYTNTTWLLTERREKLPLNPSESTGNTLWKKANEFNRNNSLR